MTEQLKPCPFCGDTRIKRYGGGLSQEAPVTLCTGCHTQVLGHELWNNRPYENQLKADAVRDAVECGYTEYGLSATGMLEYAEKLERGE